MQALSGSRVTAWLELAGFAGGQSGAMLSINFRSLSYSLLQEKESCWDDSVCTASPRTTSAWRLTTSARLLASAGHFKLSSTLGLITLSGATVDLQKLNQRILLGRKHCVLNLRHAQGSCSNYGGELQPCLAGLDASLLPPTPVVSPTSHATALMSSQKSTREGRWDL